MLVGILLNPYPLALMLFVFHTLQSLLFLSSVEYLSSLIHS